MKNKLKEIKKIINEYYINEFGEDCTINNETLYDNIEDLGIAYTNSSDFFEEDELYEIQVSTNIINKSVLTYIDGQLLEEYKYPTWEEYKEYLNHLDFDEQIMCANDVYKNWKEMCS